MAQLTRHRARLGGAALLAAAALVLGGCASSDATPETDTNTVTVALPGALSSLYPGQEAGILNYYLAANVLEGLVAIDPEGNLAPALAESWEQPDPQTYVYRIREDATFHDGSPVTVDDILYSIEQSGDPEVSPQFSFWYDNVAEVVESGEQEITITLVEPDVGFAWLPSASAGLFVAPRAFWEEHDGAIGTSEALLVGSGPYRVSEFVPDSHILLDAVDTWWGGVPAVDSLRFEVVPDENTRLLAQRSGDVDISFNVPLQQSAQWEDAEGTEVVFTPNRSYVGLTFDTRVGPFADQRVRNAIAHSIDRDAIVETVLRGHGEVATALLTPSQLETEHEPAEARALLADLPRYDFDLETARAELAASGHPDGFATELVFPNTLPELGLAGQSLAQNLAEIGITVTVSEVPISQWFETLGDGEHGLAFMSYTSTTGDPAELTSWFLGPDNLAGYDNAEIAGLLADARVELDPARRLDLLIETNRLQAVDNAYFPLWWGERAVALSERVSLPDHETFTFVSPWGARITLDEG